MPRETYYSNKSNQKEKYFCKICSRLVLRRKDTAVFLTINARPIFLQLLSDFIFFLKNSSNRRIIHKYLEKYLRLNSDGHISIKYFWNFFFINPFHAEATFIYGRKIQKVLKTILTLSCWYSLEKLSLSPIRCQCFSGFSAFLHHFCDEQIRHQQPKG